MPQPRTTRIRVRLTKGALEWLMDEAKRRGFVSRRWPARAMIGPVVNSLVEEHLNGKAEPEYLKLAKEIRSVAWDKVLLTGGKGGGLLLKP